MTSNVVSLDPHQPRQLPANEAAEQALLSAILMRNGVIDEVGDFLRPEHFHFRGHPAIFGAAVDLYRQGRTVDVITVSAALQSDEDVQAIGGSNYLADLFASVGLPSNAADYGRMILDMALRRDLIGASQAVITDAFQADIERPGTDQAEDAVRRMTEIAEASLAPQSGPRPIGEAVDGLLDQLAAVAAARGEIVGHSTGLHDLDQMIGGLLAPDLLVLAARPGMGKSVLALNIAEHVATHHGPVVFYSLEMSKAQLISRLIATPTGIPTDRQRSGPIRSGEYVMLQEAAQNVGRLPLLLDDGRQRSVASMRAHSRRTKRRQGLALVVIDYLQLMVQGDPRYRVQEVSRITRDLKMLALDLDVPVLAISQLSREVERRDDKRPRLSDLRESGSIEQDADEVMFLYREEYYLRGTDIETWEKRRACEGSAEIIIDKNRHGRTGTVTARFDGVRQRFSDQPGAGQQEML